VPMAPMEIGKDGLRVGVRVIRLGIWRELLEIDWCRYLHAVDQGVSGVSPPMLTSNTQRIVFFTDMPSVASCFDAESLAERLALAEIDRFRREGALVVCFPLSGLEIRLPEIDGVEHLLTDGGGRQWIVPRNVPFSEESMLFEVLPRPQADEGLVDDGESQEGWLHVGWRYANPKLSTEAYRTAVLLGLEASGEYIPSDLADLDATLRSLPGDEPSR